MSEYDKGPIGFIYHKSSGSLVHPYRGSRQPANDTRLVVHSSNDDKDRLQVRFIPVEGHFGYIEHVSSGRIVHPKGGKCNPQNNTALVFHSDQHAGALFAFDEVNNRIMHKGGRIWHPKGGELSPSNDTICVLHSHTHEAAQFYFGNSNGDPISPYPDRPRLGGDWKILLAFISPKASHSQTYEYHTGRFLSQSVTKTQPWNVNAESVCKMFRREPAFSKFAQEANRGTWSEKEKKTDTVHVIEGESLVLWQYEFSMRRYDEEWSFRSDVIESTNSKSETPKR